MARKIANKLIQKVEVRLDSKIWPIVITHNMPIECEDITGMNLLSGEVNLPRPSTKLIRALLFSRFSKLEPNTRLNRSAS